MTKRPGSRSTSNWLGTTAYFPSAEIAAAPQFVFDDDPGSKMSRPPFTGWPLYVTRPQTCTVFQPGEGRSQPGAVRTAASSTPRIVDAPIRDANACNRRSSRNRIRALLGFSRRGARNRIGNQPIADGVQGRYASIESSVVDDRNSKVRRIRRPVKERSKEPGRLQGAPAGRISSQSYS